MKIVLNGKDHALENPVSIEGLLQSIHLAGKPVVVEHNQKALFPREYNATILEEGDRVEIVTIAAGG